jgi:hypothetical protein
MARRCGPVRGHHPGVGLVAFLLLGVAITVGAVLMIVVPVAIGLALLASVFRRPS